MMSDDSLIDCIFDVRSIFLWFRDGDFGNWNTFLEMWNADF